ncbi:hypothetical protein ACQJBY_060759 [Aegilops geniculata]
MAWGPWPVAAGSHGCAWRHRSRTPDPGSPHRPLGPRGAVHHAQAGGHRSADDVPLPPVPERGCNEEKAARVPEGVAAEGWPWAMALVPHRRTEVRLRRRRFVAMRECIRRRSSAVAYFSNREQSA